MRPGVRETDRLSPVKQRTHAHAKLEPSKWHDVEHELWKMITIFLWCLMDQYWFYSCAPLDTPSVKQPNKMSCLTVGCMARSQRTDAAADERWFHGMTRQSAAQPVRSEWISTRSLKKVLLCQQQWVAFFAWPKQTGESRHDPIRAFSSPSTDQISVRQFAPPIRVINLCVFKHISVSTFFGVASANGTMLFTYNRSLTNHRWAR